MLNTAQTGGPESWEIGGMAGMGCAGASQPGAGMGPWGCAGSPPSSAPAHPGGHSQIFKDPLERCRAQPRYCRAWLKRFFIRNCLKPARGGWIPAELLQEGAESPGQPRCSQRLCVSASSWQRQEFAAGASPGSRGLFVSAQQDRPSSPALLSGLCYKPDVSVAAPSVPSSSSPAAASFKAPKSLLTPHRTP